MFFLITGTRSTRKRIGYVADYCPVCMEIRPFVFSSYGKGDHVFFVSLGQKSTSGYLKCCTECGVELQAHLTDYAGSSKRHVDLEELITLSQPGARALFAQGLETGARLRSRRLMLDQQEKTDRLLRILEFFNPLVERRYFNWSDFDKYSSAGCLGTIAIFVALFYQGCLLGSLVGWPWFKAAFATILVGLVVTLVISAFGPARFVRGHIIPGLAKGMKMCHPTEADLSAVLARAKSLGLKIGKKVKVPALATALQEMPESSGDPLNLVQRPR